MACREFKSHTPEGRVEIIFVDNNSSQDHSGSIKAYCEKSDLKFEIFRLKTNNMAIARNTALRAAAYEHLVFLDSDCHPNTNWLTSYHDLSQKHLHGDTAAIAGENIAPLEDLWLYRYIRLLKKYPVLHLNSTQVLAGAETIRTVRHAPTCNILYRRSLLLQSNGFDDRFYRTGEDLELNTRLTSLGHQIAFSGKPVVFHHDRSHLISWMKKVFFYGKIQPRILSMYPKHADKERWFPLALIFILLIGLCFAPITMAIATLGALMSFVFLGLLSGAGLSALPWATFILLTAIIYCAGYAAGLPLVFLNSRKPIPQKSE